MIKSVNGNEEESQNGRKSINGVDSVDNDEGDNMEVIMDVSTNVNDIYGVI